MMLGEVIGEVLSAGSPVDDKLVLFDAVANPVETHVHGAGFALFECVIGDAGCGGVVGFHWGRRLRMAEFF